MRSTSYLCSACWIRSDEDPWQICFHDNIGTFARGSRMLVNPRVYTIMVGTIFSGAGTLLGYYTLCAPRLWPASRWHFKLTRLAGFLHTYYRVLYLEYNRWWWCGGGGVCVWGGHIRRLPKSLCSDSHLCVFIWASLAVCGLLQSNAPILLTLSIIVACSATYKLYAFPTT